MNQYMSKKRPPPCQKEIFDQLKLPPLSLDPSITPGVGEVCSAQGIYSNGSHSSTDVKDTDVSVLTVTCKLASSTVIDSPIFSSTSPDRNLIETQAVDDIADCALPMELKPIEDLDAQKECYVTERDIMEYSQIQSKVADNPSNGNEDSSPVCDTSSICECRSDSTDSEKRCPKSSVGSISGLANEGSLLWAGMSTHTNIVTNIEYYLNPADSSRNDITVGNVVSHYTNYVPFEARVHEKMSKLNEISG